MRMKEQTSNVWISMMGVVLLLSSGPLIAGGDLFSVRANGSVVLRLTNAMEMFTLQETGENKYQYSYTIDMTETTGILDGVTNHVTIDGRNGNNNITVMGSYPRNLIIRGGRDDDDVSLIGVEVGRNLTISLQSGDNSVDAVGLLVDDDTAITTAGGEDEITLSSFTSGDRLTVRSGAGDDAVTMTDAVTLGGVTSISTSTGADELTIDDAMVNGRFNVLMGRQDDTVSVTNSVFSTFTTVNAGNQDDDVTVTGNTFEKRVAILGASGTADIYRDDESNVFESISVNTGFETIENPTEMMDAEVLLGDVDLSGVVDSEDIAAFNAVLSVGGFQAEADCNEDGIVDLLDRDACNFPYAIGDTGPGGGIVFSVSADGTSGLEAAPEDQSTGVQWCNVFTDIQTEVRDPIQAIDNLGFDGPADTNSGAVNTPLIIAACGASAAGVAAAYVWPNGQTDGFLPNREELNVLFNQRTVVGGFAGGFYWSSSEFDNIGAWFQDFDDGSQTIASKDITLRVRAVRAF